MIRMSKLTDYAILVLAYLAETREPRHSAADVADHTGLTAATASKPAPCGARTTSPREPEGRRSGCQLLDPSQPPRQNGTARRKTTSWSSGICSTRAGIARSSTG